MMFEAAVAAIVVVLMIGWTWQPLEQVRTQLSPTFAAVDWITHHVPRGSVIYVERNVRPFAEFYLAGYELRYPDDEIADNLARRRSGYFFGEGTAKVPGAVNFVWPRNRLWHLVRRRYFATSVQPLRATCDFRDGWYGQEASWRWMGKRSVTTLPAFDGKGRLSLSFYVPLDALPAPPSITITMNGALVDRFVATTSNIDRDWIVPSAAGANELVIETDRVVVPKDLGRGEDPRSLGLRLGGLRWTPEIAIPTS